MYLLTINIDLHHFRYYAFGAAYEAEEFAYMHGGSAHAGKDECGRWIAVI